MEDGTTKVIIVGGGFAGLNCAQKLAHHKNLQIVVLDKNNYQQFQPLLYQVATGTLSPDNAAFNLRAVLARHANVDVAMTEIQSVDLAKRAAYSVSGDEFQGDFLVLAAGAEPNSFNIPGVSDYALPLYSLTDAQRLRSRLLEALEAADREPAKYRDALRFVVIGGGPTGVEIAGAIADVLQRTPDYAFKHVNLKHASVTLIDGLNTVLGPFSKHSQDYVMETLKQRSVELRLGASVREITRDAVLLSDGARVPADVVIWAGGLKASRLSGSLGIQTGRGGRVDVQPDLSVRGFPGVYALGDFANFKTSAGAALPQLASVAQQAGQHCARNIIAAVSGTSGKPFEYLDKGIMAMVGRNAAVAEVGSHRHSVTGAIAFAAWLGVHAPCSSPPLGRRSKPSWNGPGNTSETSMSTPSSIVPMRTGPIRPHRPNNSTIRRKHVSLNRPIEHIAIVGTGVIGASWAACYLARGFDVTATDPAPNAEVNLRKYVNDAWELLTASGLGPTASLDRLSFVSSVKQAVAKADFVQENGPERPEFKIKLFAEMDEAAPSDSILASSSSGLTMDVIQSGCKRPERCVIGHPFNPPHVIPLVEVVGGARTSEQTIQQAMEFYASIGKKPIRLYKALPGHVANRFQAALYKEVLYLVQQGVLSVEDADAAICYGPGLRWGVMGPSLQWHLGGGPGGIHHFMEHLMPPLAGMIGTLNAPTVTDSLKQSVVEGVLHEADNRSVEELSKQENQVLMGILNLRARAGL